MNGGGAKMRDHDPVDSAVDLNNSLKEPEATQILVANQLGDGG
jgi:hypothetical protein